MLDQYTYGVIERISPEAPVPVMQVSHRSEVAGGAGNVCLNLKALGANVFVLGRVGHDPKGLKLKNLFQKQNIDTEGLITQEGYTTTLKNRLIASSQQVLRIDEEEITDLSEDALESSIAYFKRIQSSIDLIAVSDYAKGFVTKKLMQQILSCSGNKPVFIDPKGIDFSKYQGATLIKPNLKEAALASGLTVHDPIEHMAERLFETTLANYLVITRSEKGISTFERTSGKRCDFPVHVQEITDVTGAGDTVLSTLSYAMASGLTLDEAATLSNVAAAISVQKLGCVHVSLDDLQNALIDDLIEQKVIKPSQYESLLFAIDQQDYIMLVIEDLKGLTFIDQLQKAKNEHPDCKVIAYVREHRHQHLFLHLLSSLPDVDLVLEHSQSLSQHLKKLFQGVSCIIHAQGELSSRKTQDQILQEIKY